jgi:sugar lactone lactonase YvrE
MQRSLGASIGVLLLASTLIAPLHSESPRPALDATLGFPLGIAIASDGSIYVSERRAHKVSLINPDAGTILTVVGTGEPGFSGDGGPAALAQLRCPDSIDLDAEGHLYIADRCNHRIRRVDLRSGVITTVAGTGERGASGNGPALERMLAGVFYVRSLSPSRLLFTDTDSHRVRELDLERGLVTTLAGNGAEGFSGDGGAALKASFTRPHVALRGRNGDLIIGDSFNQRIRRVDHATGRIRTIAGNGQTGTAEDGDEALTAPLNYFGEIIEMPNGDLFFTEWGNGRLMKLETSSGRLRVLAGTPNETEVVEGNPLLSTYLGGLADFAIDHQGRVVVAAAAVGLVRRIDLRAGRIETLAGR